MSTVEKELGKGKERSACHCTSFIQLYFSFLKTLFLKLYLFKLFQEWGERRIKENGGGGKIKYGTFDIF
jgi:hypothetical protein